MSHSRATNSRRRSTIWRWTCARERRRRSGRGGKRPTGPTAPDDALPRVPLQPDQEAVAEHDQNGVTMETLPQPTLVLIPAQQALGFFMELLHPIAAMGVLHHRRQRRGLREVAPEVIPVPVAAAGSLAEQPADVAVAVTVHAPAAKGDELGAQPALTAFPPADGLPLPAGQNAQDLLRPLEAPIRVPRQRDAEIGPHRHHSALAAGLPNGQKMRIIPIKRVRPDT